MTRVRKMAEQLQRNLLRRWGAHRRPEFSGGGHAPVVVGNVADGGIIYWLFKLYTFLAAVGVVAILAGSVAIYAFFATLAPSAPSLETYRNEVPGLTRILAADGTLLGELADEWRELIPYDQIPKPLWQAFVAAEDHEFFLHEGISFRGILRASWSNLRAGGWVQGGSTITQQVAKHFLSSEKTLERKIVEAILARRLERLYTKEEILSLYLNHIYLGSRAYGVQAAAERYFSRSVGELDLGQMAVLAGLAQAPSRDAPLAHPERAKVRRDEVLRRMARHGFITEEQAKTWEARPLELVPRSLVFGDRSPYFAEEIKRTIQDHEGIDDLRRAGLRVETTVLPAIDAQAADSVRYATRKQDHRQGFRGPVAHLQDERRERFLADATVRYPNGIDSPGKLYLGLVVQASASQAQVKVGAATYRLPLEKMSWAAPYSREAAENDRKIGSVLEALRVGDVIWVSRPAPLTREFSSWRYDEKMQPQWVSLKQSSKLPADVVELEQIPRVQGAILTIDHDTGYVLAMAGGNDFKTSQFNRTTQACRQPGSTYKPIYYSLALDEGYSFDTLLNDKPKAEVDPVTGEIWVPLNFQGTVDHEVTLEYALVFSKNIPSVDLFSKLGAENVKKWARRLGFTSPIIADKALALGASCTYMHELSRAFGLFARNGRALPLVTIRRIVDTQGRPVWDSSVFYDDWLNPGDRMDRIAAQAGRAPAQAISARSAYLTSNLLSKVVSSGFSSILRKTGIPAAGKTGTSSATMDLWFVAYTSRWLTSVWLGDDMRERPLGKYDAAYMAAVPMWAQYMSGATRGQPLVEIPWQVPDGMRANDRGGDKGTLAASPMPLVHHKKAVVTEMPEGVDVREKRGPASEEEQ